jgi:hypothetical protein
MVAMSRRRIEQLQGTRSEVQRNRVGGRNAGRPAAPRTEAERGRQEVGEARRQAGDEVDEGLDAKAAKRWCEEGG